MQSVEKKFTRVVSMRKPYLLSSADKMDSLPMPIDSGSIVLACTHLEHHLHTGSLCWLLCLRRACQESTSVNGMQLLLLTMYISIAVLFFPPAFATSCCQRVSLRRWLSCPCSCEWVTGGSCSCSWKPGANMGLDSVQHALENWLSVSSNCSLVSRHGRLSPEKHWVQPGS